jgi:TolB-like protein/class 3 adenylate cyclase/Tfp pilus assembly protein PilF
MTDPRAHRRLAAILAADVVGYSRLMGVDEAGTLAALRARWKDVLTPAVTRHRGRVVKVMGDGVLVEFGSAVDAVECAVAVQAGFDGANEGVPEDRRIDLRIGINLGDVIVEGADIYGDGVNIAARLEGVAEAGGIAVSAKVWAEVQGKVSVRFTDAGEVALKNIAGAVRVYRVAPLESEAGDQSGSAAPSKPSIAVLPFTNMSGDPDQEFFSDGITEDIITELSRFRDLFVIARNSSFTFKGRAVNVKQVGRELGVTYALEGSVRRAGNRVRITAQLIDCETGSHIWADRFDGELADVFAVQDEITRKIVGMLTVGLENDALERARRKPPESLVAYEHWLRGKRLLWTDGQDNLMARRHFENAISIDPGYSRAYSGLAVTWQMEALGFWNADGWRPFYGKALEYGERALELDEADYQAHISIAWPILYQGDYARMKKHIDRAIMLNPNDADTLANASYLLSIYGDADTAVACAEAAAKLNPHYPDWYEGFHSTALYVARRFDEALVFRLRQPDYFIDSTFHGAAILAQLGRLAEARVWADRAVGRLVERFGGLDRMPKSCIQIMSENNPYRLAEDRELWISSLRLAGVPE